MISINFKRHGEELFRGFQTTTLMFNCVLLSVIMNLIITLDHSKKELQEEDLS